MHPPRTLPIYRDVVLIGGGHSHVEVVRRFGMKPPPGVRLTLITPEPQTPYSGMLPGFVSGFYSYDDCHIDLFRLCTLTRTRYVQATACGLDLEAQQVQLAGRPPVQYDVLSINIGATPSVSQVPGAAEFTIPVKPISKFAGKLEQMVKTVRSNREPFRVVVVGGGPGGVELACCLRHRLDAERKSAGIDSPVSVALVSRGPILGELTPGARRTFLPLLASRHIDLYESPGGVISVLEDRVNMSDGSSLPFNACVWCTQAGSAPWLATSSSLPTDERGFLLVNDYLQSDGGPPNVFAAGDIATNLNFPKVPKAGVFAVRAGPLLAANLALAATCEQQKGSPPPRLRRWTPQNTHLNIITAGDKYGVAVKGPFVSGMMSGFALWVVKDWIDRRFMARYTDINSSMAPDPGKSEAPQDEYQKLLDSAAMRCGGCGSKVGSSILRRALARLAERPSHLHNDDAAVLPPPPQGHVTVHTIDFFRSPLGSATDDPYLLGALAASHALSDVHAMGATPMAALALAVLPFASAKKMEADLFQMMSGASKILSQDGCNIVGGHTAEGTDLACGFTIYATAPPEHITPKGCLRPGQALILTKALGTGVIFAAAAQGKAPGRVIADALKGMVVTNAEAARILRKFGATSCTDVTGFGFLGHLQEMCEASDPDLLVEVMANGVPVMPGAIEALSLGVRASLDESNTALGLSVLDSHSKDFKDRLPLLWAALVDPQTGGGLLGAVPEDRADECVAQLRLGGCQDAAVVGRVVSRECKGVGVDGEAEAKVPCCVRLI